MRHSSRTCSFLVRVRSSQGQADRVFYETLLEQKPERYATGEYDCGESVTLEWLR